MKICMGNFAHFMLVILSMEKIFKEQLNDLKNNLRPETFSAAIYSSSLKPFPQNIFSGAHYISEDKALIVQSLEKFAVKQIEENLGPKKSGVLNLNGGEIIVKPVHKPEEIFESLKIQDHIKTRLLRNKSPKRVKIIFISEISRSVDDVTFDDDDFLNQLKICFPDSAALLFQKMVKAMNLTPDQVVVYPIEDNGIDLRSDLDLLASYFELKILVTLGAKSAQRVLERNDRLSVCHGQFFTKKFIYGEELQVIPLFHPSIIETNVNMKKTAWMDMQKIMKYMEKLS